LLVKSLAVASTAVRGAQCKEGHECHDYRYCTSRCFAARGDLRELSTNSHLRSSASSLSCIARLGGSHPFTERRRRCGSPPLAACVRPGTAAGALFRKGRRVSGKTARDACPESPQRLGRESLGLTSKLPAESPGKSLPRDSGALPIVEHGNVAPRQTRFCRAKIRRAIWDRSGSRQVAKSRDCVGMRGAAKINPPALVRAVRGVDDAFRTSAR